MNLICENSVLFLVLSAVVILALCKYRGKYSGRWNMVWYMQMLLWLMFLLSNLLFCAVNIYDDLKEEPEQIVRDVYGWVDVENGKTDALFDSFLIRFDSVLPICLLLGVMSLICLFNVMHKEVVGISLVFMGMAGMAIPVLGLENGSRITASAIFSLIVVIVFLAGDLLQEGGKWIERVWKGVFIAVCIFVTVSADHLFVFLTVQNRVTQQRREITKEIEMKQHL